MRLRRAPKVSLFRMNFLESVELELTLHSMSAGGDGPGPPRRSAGAQSPFEILVR